MRNEPEDFTDLVELARSIDEVDRARIAPPADLWAKIASSIPADEKHAPVDLRSSQTEGRAPSEPDNVVPLRPGRESSWGAKLLAGAAAVALLIVGITVVSSLRAPDVDIFAAEATNTDLPEPFAGSATATVEANASPQLALEFTEAIPADEPVELWIATADLSQIVSLGTVPEGSTSWTTDWPSDLDPAEFLLVDLSFEPADGDPTHSGRSILRGEFRLT